MLRRLILPVLIVLVLCGIAGYSTNKLFHAVNPDPNHAHADFAIWIHDKKLDFSAEKYMTTEAKEDALPEGSLGKYLHLHDGNGHVVHRHKPGLGFTDFLKTIGFDFTGQPCLKTDTGEQYCNTGNTIWYMVINGKILGGVEQNYIFNDGDKIMLAYLGPGDGGWESKWKDMTNDACLYSKTCPWRGPAPTENCIADPTVPCKIQ